MFALVVEVEVLVLDLKDVCLNVVSEKSERGTAHIHSLHVRLFGDLRATQLALRGRQMASTSKTGSIQRKIILKWGNY
jgi:hypothetical protein